jgi:hypothetical protein
MHTVEPLVPEPSTFEVQIATEKLKRYNRTGTDQIRAELIQAGVIRAFWDPQTY